jgi:hypothetical protein
MLEGGVFASATPSIRVGNVRAARSRIARGTPVLLSTMRLIAFTSWPIRDDGVRIGTFRGSATLVTPESDGHARWHPGCCPDLIA